jgi:hypothetical protein
MPIHIYIYIYIYMYITSRARVVSVRLSYSMRFRRGSFDSVWLRHSSVRHPVLQQMEYSHTIHLHVWKICRNVYQALRSKQQMSIIYPSTPSTLYQRLCADRRELSKLFCL